MKVTTAALPLLPLIQRLLPGLPGLPTIPGLPALPGLSEVAALPGRLTGLSLNLLKASALEAAILAGHLLLYPSGIIQERRPAQALRPTDSRDPQPSPPPLRLPVPTSPPVVLLHGFIDNRSVFLLLRRSLAQHGRHEIESLNYSPLTCDIRTAAELLGRHVEEICERTGSERVDVVGHSLGGLIARYYVQCLGGDRRVRTLVTLGTPHAGTKVVPLANAHPIVRQMRPGSAVIDELTRPAPGCRTRFVSFWSDLDHVMDPLETACLDHPDLSVQNVRVSGIGHLALPVHPTVATGVRQALDTAGPEPETDSESGGLTIA
ncbi:lipase [Streptomyces sp. KO7888]|uniref:esterase/lipase family protein n=1 Tax=Streptomyces TaxID=1883 RepID=UPI001291F0A7|nr:MULTISPECIES: alpha/beta fold hydrolase [Streptomyces]MCX5035861.1 alpha/beta fold hydrolase [Streptomyces coelicoflavus]MDI6519644.1 alpha/beta fold hydrolase [Streptomyces coelicoflavus]NHI07679.1 lipase [Streptomyces sp. KO7888]QFX82131.1 alpha/beta fold hydrolase [Streptomyces sp. SYP-A7193]